MEMLRLLRPQRQERPAGAEDKASDRCAGSARRYATKSASPAFSRSWKQWCQYRSNMWLLRMNALFATHLLAAARFASALFHALVPDIAFHMLEASDQLLLQLQRCISSCNGALCPQNLIVQKLTVKTPYLTQVAAIYYYTLDGTVIGFGKLCTPKTWKLVARLPSPPQVNLTENFAALVNPKPKPCSLLSALTTRRS